MKLGLVKISSSLDNLDGIPIGINAHHVCTQSLSAQWLIPAYVKKCVFLALVGKLAILDPLKGGMTMRRCLDFDRPKPREAQWLFAIDSRV